MELGAQIRKLRNEQGLSQDALAERVFVSRQSVSNWETGRTYPDLKSLLLLGETFGVSLDFLVKGDIERMKQEINGQELAGFKKDSVIFTVLLVATILSPVPLLNYLDWLGAAIWAVITAAALYYSFRVEKYKKKYDIRTYKEILAFTEGKTLGEIEKAREDGKRPYQAVLYPLVAGLTGFAVTVLMFWLFK
ncbi:MAG: helix-turn-helix transcriptional regulator [Eubacteriales bacterium]|nr:helix-turn-helix transcriptional regulator [Eubacteriales bacterium]